MNFIFKKDFEILETDLLTFDSIHKEYSLFNEDVDLPHPYLAFKAFLLFREELACSENNMKYSSSGLGGNLKQYFLLLSSGIKCKEIFYKKIKENYPDEICFMKNEDLENILINNKKNQISPHFYLDNGNIIFEYDILSKITVLELRNLFDKFIVDSNIELPNISEKQIISSDYMLKFKGKSLSLDMYLKCLDACYFLNKLLNDKNLEKSLEKSLEDLEISFKDFKRNYLSEEKYLVLSYAKECGLSEIELEDSYSIFLSIFKRDKVFKNKLDELSLSYESSKDTILNSFFDQFKYAKLLSIIPKYISIIPLRLIIGYKNLCGSHFGDYVMRSNVEMHLL